MRVIFVNCLLFILILFAPAASYAGEDDTELPTYWITGMVVTESQIDRVITQIENRQFVDRAIGWVREVLRYIQTLGGDTVDVNKLCGTYKDAAETPSTATPEERNDAADKILTQTYQGLGGQGRPFARRVTVVFADGGSEQYAFNGASGHAGAIPDTLTLGSGVPARCPA